jgi:hypothetical protein
MMRVATVSRVAASPPVPTNFGVVIATNAAPDLHGDFLVHGSYRLPRALSQRIERPMVRAVALMLQVGLLGGIAMPFSDQSLFEDDDQIDHDAIVGYFNIDVFALQRGRRPGRYHVFASIDEHLSNVIELMLR